jgi:beta-phosphoglucomutase-like phosphatase (HAD superfamily)
VRRATQVNDDLAAALAAADTVFYDFDGVLADSEPVHLRSYRELMSDGGGLDESVFSTLIGRKEREIWPVVAGGADVDDLVARRADRFLAIVHEEMLELDARAAEMLRCGSGERVVLSSGSPVIVGRMLELWGIASSFSEVHALGDSPAQKADELRRLVEARRAGGPWAGVLVEDSGHMLRAGRALGLVTVGVVHSLNSRGDVEGADFVLDREP